MTTWFKYSLLRRVLKKAEGSDRPDTREGSVAKPSP